jgi:orotidine-5'-phosphate decarboxylase
MGHPLCAGLDPHLGKIPPIFRRGSMEPGDPQTAEAVEACIGAVIERLPGRVAIVKPQLAFYEQLGWPGIRALENLVSRARALGLMVLLDGKRGDIGSTAEGYARAYLHEDAVTSVDALTVNPYMGYDTLEPYLDCVERFGKGMFALVKTSNPGSGDIQDQKIDGRRVFEVVARGLASRAADLVGPETGWSSLGVVVGATYPQQLEEVREVLPNSLFLVPGYGAQGASARDAMRGFKKGPYGLEGGLVVSARGICFPDEAATAENAAVWDCAIDDALDAATSELGLAVSEEA